SIEGPSPQRRGPFVVPDCRQSRCGHPGGDPPHGAGARRDTPGFTARFGGRVASAEVITCSPHREGDRPKSLTPLKRRTTPELLSLERSGRSRLDWEIPPRGQPQEAAFRSFRSSARRFDKRRETDKIEKLPFGAGQ